MVNRPVEALRRYALIKLTRDLDSRFESLLLTGRISKWYSEVGNEATTVPSGLALEPGDVLCSLHRDLGAILAVYLDPARTFPGFGFGAADGRRQDPVELLYRLCCQLLGRADGFSQGVERSFHYAFMAPEQGIRHVGMISHLGSMIPVAAGCAFALKQDESDRVAINFIGDGGTSTGDFHEGLNMAAVWKLPLVLVVENNRYAFSTPVSQQYACASLAARGEGYGIPGVQVDGNDPDAVAAVIAEAVARARAGEGPTLVEAMLGRMRGHSEGDDSLKVVPEDELKAYTQADPVPAYAARLEREGVLDAELKERLDRRIAELVEQALDAALEAPMPDPATARRPVFAPLPESPLEVSEAPRNRIEDPPATNLDSPSVSAASGNRIEDPPVPNLDPPSDSAASGNRIEDPPVPNLDPPSDSAASGNRIDDPIITNLEDSGARTAGAPPALTSYVDAIHRALYEEMERDETVILMGQDIGVFEGAFRVTRGLHRRWPERVLDTPIAESGTLGIAAGAALLGYRPVVEMQFGDFISCGFNQLVNVAAKLYYRWQLPCPLVVRLPSGGGVGAGPFHSQNPEAWFTHVPGLKVVCPATAADALGLLKAAIRDPNPVLFFEHKFLYRRIKQALPEGEHVEALGQARVLERGKDLTLIGYGASTWTCLEAAERLAEEGTAAEVIDLRTLVPFDGETVVESLRRTHRALIVHEAPLTAGFGAEVAAQLADLAFPWLDAPIRRLTYPDRPSPFVKTLERELLPSVDKVLAASRELLAY